MPPTSRTDDRTTLPPPPTTIKLGANTFAKTWPCRAIAVQGFSLFFVPPPVRTYDLHPHRARHTPSERQPSTKTLLCGNHTKRVRLTCKSRITSGRGPQTGASDAFSSLTLTFTRATRQSSFTSRLAPWAHEAQILPYSSGHRKASLISAPPCLDRPAATTHTGRLQALPAAPTTRLRSSSRLSSDLSYFARHASSERKEKTTFSTAGSVRPSLVSHPRRLPAFTTHSHEPLCWGSRYLTDTTHHPAWLQTNASIVITISDHTD